MVANHDQYKEDVMIHDQDSVISQLKQEIERLNEAHQHNIQVHEKQLYEAEKTIAAREKELDQLYKHVQQLTAENESQSGSAHDRNALEETKRELEAAQKYASSVSSSLHHTQQKLKATENMMASLRPQLDAANGHINSLSAENQRLRSQLLSADDAIMQMRPQLDSARAEASRLSEELNMVRSTKAAGLVPLQNQLQEAEAHIAKLDAELVAVDRARFDFETECVRLRESLRFTGGLGPQLSREIERRQAAQHDLLKLDKYCRYLREQIAVLQTGKSLPPHFPPPPPHPYAECGMQDVPPAVPLQGQPQPGLIFRRN